MLGLGYGVRSMATTLRVQLSFDSASGLPADAVTNTMHFKSHSLDFHDDADAIVAQLQTGWSVLGDSLSKVLTGFIQVKVYDLNDVPPRVPISLVDDLLTFTPDTGDSLPNEVAACLSFHGAFASGQPLGRTRGRIFVGPLGVASATQETADVEVGSGLRADAMTFANGLLGAGSPSTWEWAVFSPTTAGALPWSSGDVAAGTFPVVAGYMDTAFDTVRSRGTAPRTRTSFP